MNLDKIQMKYIDVYDNLKRNIGKEVVVESGKYSGRGGKIQDIYFDGAAIKTKIQIYCKYKDKELIGVCRIYSRKDYRFADVKEPFWKRWIQ